MRPHGRQDEARATCASMGLSGPLKARQVFGLFCCLYKDECPIWILLPAVLPMGLADPLGLRIPVELAGQETFLEGRDVPFLLV